MTVLLIARTVFKLHRIVMMRHLELMNKIMLTTGMLVGYAYAMEFFIAWYSGNQYERAIFVNRAFGPYAWAYWTMISCNVFIPQVFWFKKMRTNIAVMFVVSILINIGMWFERFVIIVTSLHRDFLPSSWGMFTPTIIDVGTFTGTIGVFFFLFLLFMRWLPMVAMAEVKGVMPQADPHHHPKHEDAHDEAEEAAHAPAKNDAALPEGA
jgi:molybdopterin-containing oxidoreductase family membrane subunit